MAFNIGVLTQGGDALPQLYAGAMHTSDKACQQLTAAGSVRTYVPAGIREIRYRQ